MERIADFRFVQLGLFARAGAPQPPRVRLALEGWGLVVGGEVLLAAWADLGVEALRERYSRNERTATTMTADVRRLFRYLQAMGANRLEDVTCELVTRWFWAARPETRRAR